MLSPRNVAGDPLRVQLPSVAPGNVLEVDFRFTVERIGLYYYDEAFEMDLFAVVRFDGAEPVVPSDETFAIVNGSSGAAAPALISPFDDRHSFGIVANAVIPAGATTAIVEILSADSSPYRVGGDVEQGLSATLKVSEFQPSFVTAAGPGTLVPTSSL
jgi:hypothetical protein